MRYLLLGAVLTLAACTDSEMEGVHDIEMEEAATPHLFFEIDPTTDVAEGNPLEYVNIHCTADVGGPHRDSMYYINMWRNERGWQSPGYNYLIKQDGTIINYMPVDNDCLVEIGEVSNGVYGINSRSINIAYVGGVRSARGRLLAYDTRTPAQVEAMHDLVQEIVCRCPNAQIKGHREHPNVGKECPSFRASDELGCLYLK